MIKALKPLPHMGPNPPIRLTAYISQKQNIRHTPAAWLLLMMLRYLPGAKNKNHHELQAVHSGTRKKQTNDFDIAGAASVRIGWEGGAVAARRRDLNRYLTDANNWTINAV